MLLEVQGTRSWGVGESSGGTHKTNAGLRVFLRDLISAASRNDKLSRVKHELSERSGDITDSIYSLSPGTSPWSLSTGPIARFVNTMVAGR